jgi:pyridoxamine 5'-phosphate oxidase
LTKSRGEQDLEDKPKILNMSEMCKMSEGELCVADDPLQTLIVWLAEAKALCLPEPTAMTLATASLAGAPSARVVLFKGLSISNSSQFKGRQGIEFYTNYESRKSQQLNENPRAALVFHWVQLRRQVRVEGVVEKVAPEDSDRYFQSRPRESQIGAWSSPQSRPIESREALEELVRKSQLKFVSGPIPCPPNWGGWRLVPSLVEFWEERPHRLHERKEFRLINGSWSVRRLAP